jgi:hypothetical protein
MDDQVIAQRRKLGYILIAVALLPFFLNIVDELNYYHYSPEVVGLSILVWALSLFPLIIYLIYFGTNSKQVPFFEMFCFLHGVFYSLPMFVIDPYSIKLWVDPKGGYDSMMEHVLIGIGIMICGYYVASKAAFIGLKSSTTTSELDSLIKLKKAASITIFFVFGITILDETIEMPTDLTQPVTGLKNCGQLAEAILFYLVLKKKLENKYLVLLISSFLLRLIFVLTSGLVAGLIVIFISIGLVFWVSKVKIAPVSVLLFILISVGILSLKGIIGDFRKVVWGDDKDQLSRLQKVELLLDLAQEQSSVNQANKNILAGGIDAMLIRSNLSNTFAYTWQLTPKAVPYWDGGSYKSILTFFIPRFLWKDKPKSNNGQEFGHRYFILDVQDKSTSVNLPIMIEFFINFGEKGIFIGMLFLGLSCAFIEMFFLSKPHNTLLQLKGIVLLYPLFNIESDLTLLFSGLLFNAIVLKVYIRLLTS